MYHFQHCNNLVLSYNQTPLSRLRNVRFVSIFKSFFSISIFDETRFLLCLIYFIIQHLCLSINLHFDLKRLGPRHLYAAYDPPH